MYRITPLSKASYLDFPRIHFYGNYCADASTPNNENCAFDPDITIDQDYNWNYIGTNEFSFQDTFVTGVTNKDGVTGSNDKVIGASVLDSGSHPFAKMVDLDVDGQPYVTTIYGMVFRVVWKDGVEALKGKWATNVISQSLWKKSKCYKGSEGSFVFGAQSTTTINDITWGDLRGSGVLSELKELCEKGNKKLQLSISLSIYTRNYEDFADKNFTLGLITGTIGHSTDLEPLNYGGERLLSYTDIKNQPDTSNIPTNDDCYKYNYDENFHWIHNAPFKINEEHKLLSIDLSNSLPVGLGGYLRYINPLHAGIMSESNCIELLGHEIRYCGDDHNGGPYCGNDWLKLTGGIIDITLEEHQLASLLSSATLVMVLMQDKSSETNEVYTNCDASALHSTPKHKLKLMLQEANHYFRPTESYTYHVHPSISETLSIPFILSHLGKPLPNTNVKVQVKRKDILPINGIIPKNWIVMTDDNGMATFEFFATAKMSSMRKYDKCSCSKCNEDNTLPIDGQLYMFDFCLAGKECSNLLNPISIRVFSDPTYKEPYTWDEHVKPIFTQYYHLYPVMRSILNMSDYDSVSSTHNIGLLKLSMNLSINDASYMPVTRDLPKPQQDMILKWLENPIKNIIMERSFVKDSTSEVIPELKCNEPEHIVAVSSFEEKVRPLVCQSKAVPFNIQDYCKDYVDDYYFATLKVPKKRSKFANCNCPPGYRPLYHYNKNSDDPKIQKKCNVQNLHKQLQIGLQLELATIPLYITSLYSIGDGCNPEVYQTIRGILMQEMLHMALVGNIIIAMKKEYPLIDSPLSAPRYPSVGLPGCVHPSLYIHLKKASLKHIYEVLQVLEKPKLSCIVENHPETASNTIGEFYIEIEQCIQKLDEKKEQVFYPNTLQVSWPWKPSEKLGELIQVKNAQTALNAIEQIVEQGEGASPIDPKVTDTDQLGHYYQLMEIVCQKKLKRVDKDHYAYNGDNVTFDPNGIWPMRDNPNKEGTTGNCYTEARAFHTTYHRLLGELQATFSGKPERVKSAVTVMESLLIHAKRVMRVPFDEESERPDTCGPVWDYEWNYGD